MEVSSMRPLLQGLCCNSLWNYAVFWKVKNQQEMIFIWEDGFCDISKSRSANPIEGSYLENLTKVASHATSPVLDSLDGTSGEYPIELAVTEMSSSSHLLGEGIVGRAALAGIAHWLYPDYMSSDMFDSFMDLENPGKWLLQFAAGIKTILFLPVTPYGVLQLGSVEMVAEDSSLVAYVMDTFEAHQLSDGREPEYSNQWFNSAMVNFEESLTSYGEKVDEQRKANHAVMTNGHNSHMSPVAPLCDVQDLYSSSVGKFTDTPENVIGGQFTWHSLGMFHAADTYQLLREDKELALAESSVSKYLHFDENVGNFPYVDNEVECGDFVHGLMGFSFEESANEPTFGNCDFNSFFESESNFFSLVTESDLHKALESAVVEDADLYTFDSSISNHSLAYSSVHDLSCIKETAGNESAGFSLNEEVKHLLEAVVATTFGDSFDVNTPDSSMITSLSMTSKGHLSSPETTTQPKRSATPEEDTSPWSVTSAFVTTERKTACSDLSAQESSIESKTGTNRPQKRKADGLLNPVKLSNLSMTGKRKVSRLSTVDNQKPKPRDRQMIQDRIKELRDLIPNSEKCSIDGLLDKTIKHMHFLRSVTDQSDKLRHQNLKEETAENISKPVEAIRGRQKGASWAVELGPEQQACPIVVKDLDRPGHMLIEMLCTDHDRFLEITDVIHRLQLTILKGLMEEKPDNSWARFIVQVSGNFHRLDIFWPLMQLM